jgi:cytochrome b involved in lipid metabolism
MVKLKQYTPEEIKLHNTKLDAWVIINNNVYNITPIIDNHNQGILSTLGKDATETFNLFHGNSLKMKIKLRKYLIGKVANSHTSSIFFTKLICCFTHNHKIV